MPTTVQRQRKKSMPLRKSQRRNPHQRLLNQTLWEMRSENNLMKCKTQEEPPSEIQEVQLEEGIPQDTANKNLCKHTPDVQRFLVIPTKGMAYIHGTATKMIVCIDNAQHPLIIDSGAHYSIVARNIWKTTSLTANNSYFPPTQRTTKVHQGRSLPLGQLSKG
ncbi:hypothetical protein O181_026753 [Austropuccinia psidii MF-1]|uniref:Uncharacterized protein n=1 Tax=Austropuccinia psidii MF-1 TaxID=1389203 RepID=A0A9Q3CN64_9BASI|nr:hypothetical protein [Austropuccinia psidii MF-1]